MKKNQFDADYLPDKIDLTGKSPYPVIDWIKEKRLDIAYGEGPMQKMDLYYPENAEAPFPTVIIIHGGGFMEGDKRDLHLYPGFFALLEGFALVSINYGLAPPAVFPSPVLDVKADICYLRAHARELKLDDGNFFLYGTSAGGNLATYAGLDGEAARGTENDHQGRAARGPFILFLSFSAK